jgi:cell division protein FtsL
MLTVLIIVGIFFLILIILGIRKTYKLNQENRRLNELHSKQLEKEKENEGYKDFTEGHLYQNNK